MKIKKAYELFKAFEEVFCCPLCHAPMAFQNENSLVCQKGHCFDLAKQGYINFAPHQGEMKYTKGLFESRRRIFQAGFYDPVITCIAELMGQHGKTPALTRAMDAGCGEGFFASGLFANKAPALCMFAMDLLKDAIVMAAKQTPGIAWMVGNLSNIPLQPDSVDVVFNILAPASYAEFARVLKKDGILIKAVPGECYLKELRDHVKGRLIRKEYSNEEVLRNFRKKMAVVETKHLFYQLPVTAPQAESFMGMTPLTFGLDPAVVRPGDIGEITVDVEIIVGKKAG